MICPLCWGLASLPREEENACPFCNSELCSLSVYEPLDLFLEKWSVEQLQELEKKKKMEIKATHWWRDRRHRFYLKDALQGIKTVLKLKKNL